MPRSTLLSAVGCLGQGLGDTTQFEKCDVRDPYKALATHERVFLEEAAMSGKE